MGTGTGVKPQGGSMAGGLTAMRLNSSSGDIAAQQRNDVGGKERVRSSSIGPVLRSPDECDMLPERSATAAISWCLTCTAAAAPESIPCTTPLTLGMVRCLQRHQKPWCTQDPWW